MKNFNGRQVSEESEGYFGSFFGFLIKSGSFLGAMFMATRGLNFIIDPNLPHVEHLADSGIKLVFSVIKILVCGLILYGIYQVFIIPPPPDKNYDRWEDGEI